MSKLRKFGVVFGLTGLALSITLWVVSAFTFVCYSYFGIYMGAGRGIVGISWGAGAPPVGSGFSTFPWRENMVGEPTMLWWFHKKFWADGGDVGMPLWFLACMFAIITVIALRRSKAARQTA